MSGSLFALLERLHGHLAVLALALLVHPLVSLRRRPGLAVWTRRTAELSAALLLAVYALGWALYPSYRRELKPDLVQGALPLALRFETKEHLAILALALVLGGALTLRVAGLRPDARTAAWWMLAMGLLCGLGTGLLGVWVASGAHLAW